MIPQHVRYRPSTIFDSKTWCSGLMDFSRRAPSVVCLTAGDWIEGELSIGVERPLMRFKDEKNICAPKNFSKTFSFSSVIHLQPFGQQKQYDITFLHNRL